MVQVGIQCRGPISGRFRSDGASKKEVVEGGSTASGLMLGRHINGAMVRSVIQPCGIDKGDTPELDSQSCCVQNASNYLFQSPVRPFGQAVLTGLGRTGGLDNISMLVCCFAKLFCHEFAAIVCLDR